MKSLVNKPLVLILSFLILGIALIFIVKNSSAAASISDNVSGWAWSETIGWISFNCSNTGSCGSSNYGVNVKNNGDLEGYAWSENIGWISFKKQDTDDCPSSPCRPKLNQSNGQISGWAKALAARDGWDGWIHLRGSNYGVSASNCDWSGYAWGSDVVGWIHFKGTNYGVLGNGGACVAQCQDTVDNDGDGLIDYPNDLGCSSATDTNETNACTDAVDNDGDGKIDFPADPGCSSAQDNDETDVTQCSDTVDNDGDGKIDYPADPGCSSTTDNDETDPPEPKFKEIPPE